MNALALYFRYALRSFIRGRSRSLFGTFCVAVGVASVVALGLVGGNFRDAVTGDAQKLNRGDVSLAFPGQGVSLQGYRYFAQLEAQGRITDYTPLLRLDAMIKTPGGDQNNVMIGGLVAVESQKFPFYDTISGDKPSGLSLKTLLAYPNDAIVSHTVFNALHLRIGGPVRVVFRYGGSHTYRVTGIVPDNAQEPGFGSGLFPYFVMANISSITSYERANDLAASSVYMKTRDTAQAASTKAALERHFGPLISPKTIADVEKDSENGANGFNTFFRVMGLIAVVIGGIGIVNTMLVAARRRLKEIAVLKAVGMKGRHVVLVFTIESLLLAVAGTAAGVLLGILASMEVNSITQSMAGYSIPWSLHPDALLAGALVGIVATVLFAYVPAVRASRQRPVAALRSDMETTVKVGWFRRLVGVIRERPLRRRPLATVGSALCRLPGGIIRLPRRPGLHTTLLILFLAALMGVLAVLYTGLATGPRAVVQGAIAGIATLLLAGLITQVFVALVWLISKLPALGRLPLRMAFRSMGTQKRRLGSTLLALSVGILAIGSIAILAQNIKHELAQGLEKRQNFNVAVQEPHNPATLARTNAVIAHLGGDVLHKYNGTIANQMTLASVDGKPINAIIRDALTARDKQGHLKHGKDDLQQAVQNIRGLIGRDLRRGGDKYLIDKGRNLGPQDAGTDHIVVSNDFASILGIKVGSHLVYAEGSRRVPFLVVGIAAQNNFLTFAESMADLGYMQREGLASPSPSHNAIILLDIKQAYLKADVGKLRQTVPGGFVLDLDSFLEFTQIIDKLALFPETIAGLALFAGVIIIANTVALAMLERRREIGVMKAVGAKRRTILQFLLVENAIVGFLGAGVGVLFAMLATYLVNQNLLNFPTSYDWTTIGVLLLLGIALAVGASSLTALPASGEKPMHVLRYE